VRRFVLPPLGRTSHVMIKATLSVEQATAEIFWSL
jgi:hypothetical protein